MLLYKVKLSPEERAEKVKRVRDIKLFLRFETGYERSELQNELESLQDELG